MLKEYCGFKKIYIACGYTDLRNGIDGLASIIQNHFSLDPFDEGTLFLFCGRKTNRVKGLLWETDGFLLLYKRLEEGRFQWPRKTEDIENISIEQYHWLLEGMAITQRKTIQKVERKMIL